MSHLASTHFMCLHECCRSELHGLRRAGGELSLTKPNVDKAFYANDSGQITSSCRTWSIYPERDLHCFSFTAKCAGRQEKKQPKRRDLRSFVQRRLLRTCDTFLPAQCGTA
eukprot:597095-Amphidinium_carterae.1